LEVQYLTASRIKLELKGERLSDEALAAIVVERRSYSFEEVDFSCNEISGLGLRPIWETCMRCTNLRTLKLYKNRIDDKGADKLAVLFQHRCSTLVEIHLSHNLLTATGVQALVRAVDESRPAHMKPLWLRVEHNFVQDAAWFLEDLKKEYSVCGDITEERGGNCDCTRDWCIHKAKIHLPFFTKQKRWDQWPDGGSGDAVGGRDGTVRSWSEGSRFGYLGGDGADGAGAWPHDRFHLQNMRADPERENHHKFAERRTNAEQRLLDAEKRSSEAQRTNAEQRRLEMQRFEPEAEYRRYEAMRADVEQRRFDRHRGQDCSDEPEYSDMSEQEEARQRSSRDARRARTRRCRADEDHVEIPPSEASHGSRPGPSSRGSSRAEDELEFRESRSHPQPRARRKVVVTPPRNGAASQPQRRQRAVLTKRGPSKDGTERASRRTVDSARSRLPEKAAVAVKEEAAHEPKAARKKVAVSERARSEASQPKSLPASAAVAKTQRHRRSTSNGATAETERERASLPKSRGGGASASSKPPKGSAVEKRGTQRTRAGADADRRPASERGSRAAAAAGAPPARKGRLKQKAQAAVVLSDSPPEDPLPGEADQEAAEDFVPLTTDPYLLMDDEL